MMIDIFAMHRREIHVIHPLDQEALGQGRLFLRTEHDWDRDLEPVRVEPIPGEPTAQRHVFELAAENATLDFKPVVRHGDSVHWATGPNKLAILTADVPQQNYPDFFSTGHGEISEVRALPSSALGRDLHYRIYLPPGYAENTLKRYPVIYMHDGKNLFFPEEAFLGREWQIDETLDRLHAMSLIDRAIVIGVRSPERETDYTPPGWDVYGRALTEELVPQIDTDLRTLPTPSERTVMGSSLGGLVSLHLAWQWPGVFGQAACLSSTFWYAPEIYERVRRDPLNRRRYLRIYLDSGWPGDNYEATLAMANALVDRGFVWGAGLHYFAFPLAEHNEGAWAARSHLPLQLFTGRLARRAAAAQRRTGAQDPGADTKTLGVPSP